MGQTYIFVTFIVIGVSIIMYGLRTTQGRTQPKMVFFERPLLTALRIKDPHEMRRVLGRIRVVYGIFLVIIGIWGLF